MYLDKLMLLLVAVGCNRHIYLMQVRRPVIYHFLGGDPKGMGAKPMIGNIGHSHSGQGERARTGCSDFDDHATTADFKNRRRS